MNSIKARDKIIICLIVLGLAVFGIVEGIIIPQNNKRKQEYLLRQQQPVTHDISSVLKYKNKYMGNASNTINLFYNLPPISSAKSTFQLYPDRLALEVKYKTSIDANSLKVENNKIKEFRDKKLCRALIYNSTAAFALIENLNEIDYNFKNVDARVTRFELQKWYGNDMTRLLPNKTWKNEVQKKLNNSKYVEDCVKDTFQVK